MEVSHLVPPTAAALAGDAQTELPPVLEQLRRRPGGKLLLRVLSLERVWATYRSIDAAVDSEHFLTAALEALAVRYRLTPDDLSRIPASGSLLVVANHPFGGIEGLVLAALLRARRPDVRIMVNELLASMTQLREMLIKVDPFGGSGSQQRNFRGLRDSLRWLDQGGVLAMFPAGEVAHFDLRRRGISDPPWSETVARLAQRTGAAVLPIHFEGRNGALFQAAGLLHPMLRTVLLPGELLRRRNHTVVARIGEVIPNRQLTALSDDRAATAFLRLRTEVLGMRDAPALSRVRTPLRTRLFRSAGDRVRQPPAAPAGPAKLAEEIARLPEDQILAYSGDCRVVCARAEQIPLLLQEIGRLREITFRSVGEGTGREIDLDHFDPSYLHLLVWNDERQEVAGSYRIGVTSRLIAERGLDGIYTHSLFRLSPRLLQQLGPALELGRSFVRREYQRSMAGLPLLWKGIGKLVAASDSYRYLLGPVSISAAYSPLSRRLLVSYLGRHHLDPQLARLVKPRLPVRQRPGHLERRVEPWLTNLEELDDWISHIEGGAFGVPVLIRQYLRLGGRFLAFNLDPEFSSVIDGLVLVDLAETDAKVLVRFMGKEEAAGFLARHDRPCP